MWPQRKPKKVNLKPFLFLLVPGMMCEGHPGILQPLKARGCRIYTL